MPPSSGIATSAAVSIIAERPNVKPTVPAPATSAVQVLTAGM
eukprot:CAMPEP_0172738820 /NCGR_PEP_ID=MMETSP1074-20121228/121081_1 /TAXON_ID=2916 /ORGANISM="Ceratium fusus, Strain PA161109" /LENGTH=41 /DNA_ID= /DNA_START= /DNA_END= /DNA_ORIENTATION=